MNSSGKSHKAFTLIEVMIVMVIIGLIAGLGIFALSGARSSARDEKRKTDLRHISSAFEKYRSDCGQYPTTNRFNSVSVGGNLMGDGSTPSCRSADIYLEGKPGDPGHPSTVYSYNLISPSSYVLCAALESPPGTPPNIASCGPCGSSSCNLVVRNP